MVNDIPAETASSAVAFMASMKKKAELMMATGDMLDDKPKNWSNKPIFKSDEEALKVIKEIMRRVEYGDSWRNASMELGFSPETTRAWAVRKGLFKPDSSAAKKRKKHDKLSEKVDTLRAQGMRLQDALKRVKGLDGDQYQRSRQRRGLPPFNQRFGA